MIPVVKNIDIAHHVAKEYIRRAQPRMKDHHNPHALPAKHQVGEQVWVYTPRNRKGLSKKLAHNYHRPYRILKFASSKLRIIAIFQPQSTYLKPYVSTNTCPIWQPPKLVDEPYLTEEDFPADSFLVEKHAGLTESQASHHINPPTFTPELTQSENAAPRTTDSIRDIPRPRWWYGGFLNKNGVIHETHLENYQHGVTGVYSNHS